MNYLAIATTIMFALICAFIPEHSIPASVIVCTSYALWGFSYYSDKKFEKKTIEKDPEISELEMQLCKSELNAKISELNRHNAAQENRFAQKQKQDKAFEKGISW